MWGEVVEALPAKDVRYIVYDFQFKDIQSGYHDGDLDTVPIKSKIMLMSWAPDNCKPQLKMLVPSSMAPIKELGKAVSNTLQSSCIEDVTFVSICDKLGIKLS